MVLCIAVRRQVLRFHTPLAVMVHTFHQSLKVVDPHRRWAHQTDHIHLRDLHLAHLLLKVRRHLAHTIPRSVTAPMQQTARSYTPTDHQQRSFTGYGPPPDRSFTPGANPPPLPRLQSPNTVANTGYKAYSPQSTTPSSAYPNQTYHSYERPRENGDINDGRNEDANRDSGFDDIINHYRR